jgi:uncharacterized membrane protein (UPF0127 family)
MNFLSHRTKGALVCCTALLAAATSLPVTAQQTPTEMRVTTLNVGINVIRAEVAANDPDREKGLMFRTGLGGNQGMVFVFDRADQECMWMKNTLIPLSVAFMDNDGKILNVEDMQPQTENNHCAKGPARYALEMNLGWFTAHGVKPGATIDHLPPHN